MENENLNQTKEKMIKRCRVFGKILLGVKWVCIILPVVLLLSIGLMVQWNSTEVENPNEMITQESNAFEEENSNDIITQENNVLDEEISFFELIVGIVGVVFSLVLVNSVGKVFLNISKEGTPFSKNIIKSIKDICIFSTIIWVVGLFSEMFNMGLVFLLTIWAMYYIFKYGYQLQLESDETL